MRIAIGFTGAVMAVIIAIRGEMFEPGVDILDQAVLCIIDVDACGDVHGGDEDHAFADAALAEGRFDLRGDVDVFAVFCGLGR